MIYLQLVFEFFKTGLFAVGGGLATIPFLARIADRYPWFDREMLANMIAISESTPGAMGINMATYAGFHTAGVPGAVIATAALVAPAFIVILVVAKFLDRFRENFYVQSVFYGLRPAATGLIAAAVLEVFKVSMITVGRYLGSHHLLDIADWRFVLLFGILFFFIMKFKKHPILYIAAAAIAGIVFQF